MKPDPDILADLAQALPGEPRPYRISIRLGEEALLSRESRAPLGDIADFDAPEGAECRIEQRLDDGPYSTLVPYFRLSPPAAAEPIHLEGPTDPNGLPVRLMIYDETARAYVDDHARFGGRFVADAAVLPMQHPLRARYLHWSDAEKGWKSVGVGALLPGSGRLGRPQVGDSHRGAARALRERLDALIPPAERGAGDVLEFYDAELLADIAADASPEALEAVLARLAAGASTLDLRVRATRLAQDGKQAGPLLKLVDPQPPFEALIELLRGRESAAPAAARLLDFSRRDDGPTLRGVVTLILFRALSEGIANNEVGLKPVGVEALCEGWDALPDGSELVGELLTYIQLYGALQREAERLGELDKRFIEAGHLLGAIEPMLALLKALPPRRRDGYAARAFHAKIESLRDRERAAELFAEALASPSPMRQAATFDRGAATYLSLGRLKRNWPVIAERKRALLGALQIRGRPPADRREPVFTFSCDPRFAAIYLPGWLSAAEYCRSRGMDFHFTLIGDDKALAATFEQLEALRVALANLRGFDPATYADNVTYSSIPVPEWCAEPLTFYACARYLVAGALTKAFGRDVLVQDTDFTLLHDPAAFLAKFPLDGFGVHASNGIYGIDPYRRFMAGTFFSPNSETARRHLEALEAYLVEGLSVADSWYLDQNALSFLVEQVRAAGGVVRILAGERPTQQPRINQVFEPAQPAIGAGAP